ncbi:hypothetical protein B0H16DRAFT_539366 [Mycena metata]|uniref:Uncharacterized protein n=1 Tax=Mycena metata TaxID=1033252 RepID=A0AAD7NIT8_9AGAR|nr:hypothetical protein B0H16DRAFT_539366 [Mycena metata]
MRSTRRSCAACPRPTADPRHPGTGPHRSSSPTRSLLAPRVPQALLVRAKECRAREAIIEGGDTILRISPSSASAAFTRPPTPTTTRGLPATLQIAGLSTCADVERKIWEHGAYRWLRMGFAYPLPGVMAACAHGGSLLRTTTISHRRTSDPPRPSSASQPLAPLLPTFPPQYRFKSVPRVGCSSALVLTSSFDRDKYHVGRYFADQTQAGHHNLRSLAPLSSTCISNGADVFASSYSERQLHHVCAVPTTTSRG